jgi:putative colanic acid biosynthesis UDP-glucose lipid carrier transferase
MRTLAAHLLRGLSATGVIQKTVAIYGDGPAVQEVAAALWRSRMNVRLAGIFGPSNDGAKSRNGANALKDLVAFAQARPIDTVILAIPGADARSLKPLLMELSVLPGEVQLYTGIDGGRIALRGVSTLDRLTLLDVQRKPISGWGLLAKAVEDYVVAALALILALPLFAVIAAAIKLDSDGPVFFLQRRHGFNHKIIRVWKFRTMRVMEDGDVVLQAQRGDARVTRVGAFLRRTSLDELPQLINVLKGEMSVVGPRPHALAHNVAYIGLLARYQERHRVKPGITGWAQVHGYRGPTEDAELMRKRVEYDLEYIENWSLWLDLKIIAATPIVGLFQKNAI